MRYNSRIFITGSGGFIGKTLAKKLEQDFELVKLDLPAFDLNNANHLNDLFEQHKGNKEKNYTLINCAGIMNASLSRENPDIFYETNGLGVAHLINLCDRLAIKHFVQLSSETVFGQGEKEFYEQDPRSPIHPYGISKLISELLIERSAVTKTQCTVIRLPVIVGLSQGLDNPVSIFAQEAQSQGTITLFNGGHHYRKFLHIDDLVTCVQKIVDDNKVLRQPIEFFNLPGHVLRMTDIADAIMSLLQGVKIVDISSQNQAFSLHTNSSKFEKLFNLSKRVGLPEMANEFIEWASK